MAQPETMSLAAEGVNVSTSDVSDPDSNDIDEELRLLLEEQQRIMASLSASHPETSKVAGRSSASSSAFQRLSPILGDSSSPDKLRRENTSLKARVTDLEKIVAEMTEIANCASTWEERQREYESLLAEKSETIRELRAELIGHRDRKQTIAPKEVELLQLKEELERDRLALADDEEALQEQTRQMELTLSRQRAEVGRQRVEIERMFAELQLELDQAMRESPLRDRLEPLQRRIHEFGVRTGKVTP
jgi:chromosome segregation ATPase